MHIFDETYHKALEFKQLRMAETLQRMARFVIDGEALRIIDHIAAKDARKLRSQARHLFFPSGLTWLEFPASADRQRFGLMFMGLHDESGEQSVANGMISVHPEGSGGASVGGACLQDVTRPLWLSPMARAGQQIPGSLQDALRDNFSPKAMLIGLREHEDTQRDYHFESVVLATLALLGSPRLLKVHDQSKAKLNKARLSKGKYPLLDHKEVRIDLAKREIDTVIRESDGSSRPLHFVRAHLRLWFGEIILVRPHWRGDPALGIIRPQYKVTHSDA